MPQKKLYPSEIEAIFHDAAEKRGHKIVKAQIDGLKNSILSVSCTHCGTEFDIRSGNYYRGPRDVIRPSKTGRASHNCPGCMSRMHRFVVKRRAGENHPQWKGGFGESGRDGYDRPLDNEWRRQVMKRFGGCCFITKTRDGVVCHHLNSFTKNPDQRYVVSNGIVLSESEQVHVDFHRVYGPHTNRGQFEQYCEEKYGISTFPWADGENSPALSHRDLQKRAEVYHKNFTDVVNDRGYVLVSGTYENKHSKFVLYCPKHDKTSEVSANDFLRAPVFRMRCCSNEVRDSRTPPSQKGLTRRPETIQARLATERANCDARLRERAADRGHRVLDEIFESQESLFTMRCSHHEHTKKVVYRAYMRAVYGMSCCIVRKGKPGPRRNITDGSPPL